MKWPTLAARAASTSESWPSRSTAVIESVPSEPIVVAPERTVAAPAHARASEEGSRNSPRTTSAPSSSRRLTRPGSEVSRTIARTGLPWPRSASQTAPPTLPVAPATRFTRTSSPRTERVSPRSDHDASTTGSYYARVKRRKESAMPLIEVKLYDRRINDDVVPQVIEKMTDAICEVIGEDIREHVWVLVEGLSPKQWGVGGKPTDVTKAAAT